MNEQSLPDPMTPADADLRHIEHLPVDGDTTFRSAAWLRASMEARAVMLPLHWHAFKKEVPAGSLPDDDVLLTDAVGFGMDVKRWRKVRPQVLADWILCSDGRFYHPELAKRVHAVLAGRDPLAQRSMPGRAASSSGARRQQALREKQAALRAELAALGVRTTADDSLGRLQDLLDVSRRDAARDAARDGRGVTGVTGGDAARDGDGDEARDASTVTASHGGVTAVTPKVEEEGEDRRDKRKQEPLSQIAELAQHSVTGRHGLSRSPRRADLEIDSLAQAAVAAGRFDRSPIGADRVTARHWLEDREWPADRIVEVIRARAERPGYSPPTVLSYFERPIEEALSTPAAAAPARAAGQAYRPGGGAVSLAAVDDDVWRSKLRTWIAKRSEGPGPARLAWGNNHGHEPTHPGSKIPRHILEEAEFSDVKAEQDAAWRHYLRGLIQALQRSPDEGRAYWQTHLGALQPLPWLANTRVPTDLLAEPEFARLRQPPRAA